MNDKTEFLKWAERKLRIQNRLIAHREKTAKQTTTTKMKTVCQFQRGPLMKEGKN